MYCSCEAFDSAFVLKYELEKMLGGRVPLEMLADSRPLFDFILNATRTKDRRFVIDLVAARESSLIKRYMTSGLIKSQYNLADIFTKVKSLAYDATPTIVGSYEVWFSALACGGVGHTFIMLIFSLWMPYVATLSKRISRSLRHSFLLQKKIGALRWFRMKHPYHCMATLYIYRGVSRA